MSGHTPGPWVLVPVTGVSQGFYIGTDLKRDGMNVIAEIKITEWTRDEKANACLITAAPDLFDALEGLIDQMRRPPNAGEYHKLDVTPSLAAIAKAKGQIQ